MGFTSVLALGKLALDNTIDKVQDKYERYKGRESNTHEYYGDACRRRVLSMLVHGVYFRDLTLAGEVAATLLGYQNDRAENYGKDYWDNIVPCGARDGELKELGLAFFLRKEPHPSNFAPRLAIILRGTIPYIGKDLVEDLRIAMESQRNSKRVQRCQELSWEVIQTFLHKYQETYDQICIAGHSLGAGLALLIGKHLASTYEAHIDTHLFNPPLLTFTSIVTGKFLPEKTTQTDHQVVPKQGARRIEALNPNPVQISANSSTGGQHSGADLSAVWKSVFGNDPTLENASNSNPKLQIVVGQTGKGTGILASTWVKTFGKEELEHEWNEFQKLKVWTPHFYLNPSDLVCLQYLKYYKKRHEKATIANVVDPQGIMTRLFGKSAKYISNVVPSAELYISKKFEGNPLLAHSLMQWHKFPDITLERFAARLLAGGFHFRSSARHLAHEAHMLGRHMLRSPRTPKTPQSYPHSHSSEPADGRFEADAIDEETRMLQYNYDNFVPTAL